MTSNSENLYAQEYFEYLQNRSGFRKLIRTFYLKDIAQYCTGKTIDLGCGVGELLRYLPEGSAGYEVNKVVVDHCKSIGLKVDLYSPETDDYQFKMLEAGAYQTFTMNHLLEHLEDSALVIHKIMERCHQLGIARIVFTVPGIKGYAFDKTHLTYIDLPYLRDLGVLENKYYQLKTHKYFPINWKFFSKYFTHNELRLVFDIKK